MKHPVRDRILILISAAFLIASAVVLVLMTFGVIPMDIIARGQAFIQGDTINKAIICVAALIVAVFALFLLGIILPGRKKHGQPFAVIDAEGGTVNISVKALENLVQKCLRAHPELTVVSSTIFSEGENVRITLHITLYEDISIPLVVSALQKEIKQYVQSCAGVEIDDVRVFVDGTSSAGDQITSPYRVAGTIGAGVHDIPKEEKEVIIQEKADEPPACEKEKEDENPAVVKEAQLPNVNPQEPDQSKQEGEQEKIALENAREEKIEEAQEDEWCEHPLGMQEKQENDDEQDAQALKNSAAQL